MPSGKYVLTDALVSLNGVDLSDHVKSVTITGESDEIDTTAMGTSGSREFLAGLKTWSAQVEFQQDHAAGEVDATLFPLWANGTVFACIFRPDNSDGVGATNPNFTGNAILTSYNPIAGSVGEYSQVTVPIRGTGALSRATS
jgi:hypothetical protein